MARFVFVTGGVVSSLGKGIASASLGAILEARGLKISMMKLDPYINVDPGTMIQLVEATKVPPLLLTGGLFGALIVTGFATTVPVLGVTEATLIYILGSLGAALAIDGFGLLGTTAIPVTGSRVLGIVLAVVGFVLARR